MTGPLTVVGPGRVGVFLGAAAGADQVVLGPSGRIRSNRVRLPDGTVRAWHARPVGLPTPGRVLVCTRVPYTPWRRLDPARTLLAQNGLGQELPCIACFLAVDIDLDGVVHACGGQARLVLADPGPEWAPVISAWRACGIDVQLRHDAESVRWEKCVLNATVGPLCLATGLTMRQVVQDPEFGRLVVEGTVEGAGLAARCGHPVSPSFLDEARAFFGRVGDHVPSVVEDPCELPWVLDVLLEHAEAADLPCPALADIASRLGRVPATVGRRR